MNHRSLAALALLAPAAALAQPAIFSNQSTDPNAVPLSTGATTASGVAAPAGSAWSELQADTQSLSGANAVAGFTVHAGPGVTSIGGFRLTDNFTITGYPWRIDTVTVFAYQPNAPTGVNPFSSANLRIWQGRPNQPGSTIVFGDVITNRLLSAASTHTFRVFSTASQPFPMPADTTKELWRLTLDAGQTVLAPGEYWLDWQVRPSNNLSEAMFSPTVTKPGQRTGSNGAATGAWQFRPDAGPSGDWVLCMDTGKPASAADLPMELPFVLHGYQGQPPCHADFDGDGDSGTDADIEAFFRCLAGDCCTGCGPADFDGDGDSGTDADIEAFFRVIAGHPC